MWAKSDANRQNGFISCSESISLGVEQPEIKVLDPQGWQLCSSRLIARVSENITYKRHKKPQNRTRLIRLSPGKDRFVITEKLELQHNIGLGF